MQSEIEIQGGSTEGTTQKGGGGATSDTRTQRKGGKRAQLGQERSFCVEGERWHIERCTECARCSSCVWRSAAGPGGTGAEVQLALLRKG